MRLPAPAPDRTAVVTGASSGIGTEIARDLARRGHRVTLVARSADKLADLADEVTASGGSADVLAADRTDRATRADLLARAAVDGLDKGHSVVIPGLANRVAATLAQVTPRSLLVPILAKQHPGLH